MAPHKYLSKKGQKGSFFHMSKNPNNREKSGDEGGGVKFVNVVLQTFDTRGQTKMHGFWTPFLKVPDGWSDLAHLQRQSCVRT